MDLTCFMTLMRLMINYSFSFRFNSWSRGAGFFPEETIYNFGNNEKYDIGNHITLFNY